MLDKRLVGRAGVGAAFEGEPPRRQAVDVERHRPRERRGLDARHAAERAQHAHGEGAVVVRRRAAPAAIVGGEQHALGAEAGIEAAPFLEPLEEQAGDDQHEQRERDLQSHQHLAHGAARSAPDRQAQRVLRIQAGEQPHRRRRGGERAEHAESRGHGEADAVDLGLEPDRQRAGDLAGPDGLCAPQREHQPDAGAGRREQQRLEQHQPGDAEARRPERQADAEVALPDAGPRQQQVGDVAADRGEHQQHHRLQQGQRAVDHPLRAARRIVEGVQLDAEPAVGRRVGAGQLARGGVELGASRRGRSAGAQAPQDRVAALRSIDELARARDQGAGHRRRHPHVEGQPQRRALEARRRHADDLHRLAVHADRRADGGARRAEARLPVVVGDDHDRLPSRRPGVPGVSSRPAAGRSASASK